MISGRNFIFLIVAVFFSLIFTYWSYINLNYTYTPYKVYSLKLSIDHKPLPLNGDFSKYSNPIFFQYFDSKLRFNNITFDQLFYANPDYLYDCSDFLETQFIKNPFTSNRIAVIYTSDMKSVTIQVRHKNSSVSHACLVKINTLLTETFYTNIFFVKTKLENFISTKDNKVKLLNLEAQKLGLSNSDTNYVLNLSDKDFENLFRNKTEFDKFWKDSSDRHSLKLRKHFDAVKHFNLMFDETSQYLNWIKTIKINSSEYSLITTNNSIYRIIQIFVTALVVAYLFITLSWKVFMKLQKK